MKVRRALLWAALGACAFGLQIGLGPDSALAERFYSRGLFVGFRWIWDRTLGLSPAPWLYVFLAAVLVRLGWGLARRLARRKKAGPSASLPLPPHGRTLARLLLGAVAWAGRLVFFFYLLWGFNYNRVGVGRQMGLEAAALTAADLRAELSWAAGLAAEARAAIPGAGDGALAKADRPESLETTMRARMAAVLRRAGLPAPGRVRIRALRPAGWLRRFGSDGVYIPYFGEGYVAGDLLPHERPFTLAHEMAHGYGLTDEGGVNFLAFLACRDSSDPLIRYSAAAALWIYAAGDLAAESAAEARAAWDALPAGMKADIRAAQRQAARYRGLVERASGRIYEKFLRSNQVKEGLRSYSRFVGLVAAWRKKDDASLRPL